MKIINALALLLFLAAVVGVFTLNTPATRAIQTKVMNLLSPFIKGGAEVEKTVKNIVQDPVDIASLQKENDRLNLEVERLRIIAQRYDQVLQENNKFRAMLLYKSNTRMELTAAKVIRRASANWWNTLIIDKGYTDKIRTDSPVLTDVGLIGKTGKVAAHTSEVILLTDEECRVAARVEGTLAKGIVTGERGGLEKRPDLRLKFIDRSIKVEQGANIYSSGDGGVFPAGLLIGKVKNYEIKNIAGEALIDPAVDFSLLEDVFIVNMDNTPAPS